ncbi:MAG TPA: branched-chain amino acid ABC transporter permease [Armatimonadota bacterium]
MPRNTRKSSAWRWLWPLAVLALLWVANPVISDRDRFSPYLLQIVMLSGINIVLSVSLNVVNGFAGQFSLGHAGFMAVGAYTSAYFTMSVMHTPLRLMSAGEQAAWMVGALILSGLAAGFCGWLVGMPSLRLRGDYLAIVTLGFGEIIRILIRNIDQIGGPRGLSGISPLTSFFWVGAVAALTIALSRNLLDSTHGKALLAVREDEVAAESLGVDTTGYKVTAFVLSSALAGMAGCLFAHYLVYIHPDSFWFVRSIEIIVMVIVGGLGSTTGAVLGAVIITLLPEVLRNADVLLADAHIPLPFLLKDYRMVIYSLLLILLMLVRPKGIMGGAELSWKSLRRLFRRQSEGARA